MGTNFNEIWIEIQNLKTLSVKRRPYYPRGRWVNYVLRQSYWGLMKRMRKASLMSVAFSDVVRHYSLKSSNETICNLRLQENYVRSICSHAIVSLMNTKTNIAGWSCCGRHDAWIFHWDTISQIRGMDIGLTTKFIVAVYSGLFINNRTSKFSLFGWNVIKIGKRHWQLLRMMS